MNTLTIAENPLDPNSWQTVECGDVFDEIVQRFPQWPGTARIYHGSVSQECDVTPSCEAELDALKRLSGDFWLVVYPAEPTTIAYVVIAIIVVAAVMLAPKPPSPTIRNSQAQSANNELSDRSNKARPNARIPDIFGTVRSTPDLIAQPYKFFEDHQEIEIAYMCIGRGAYDISDIRDDQTPVEDIFAASVEIYGPGTSPNSGSPVLQIGADIDEPIYSTNRLTSVNGQVLKPFTAGAIDGFYRLLDVDATNGFLIREGVNKTFSGIFEVADLITVDNGLTRSAKRTFTTAVQILSSNSFKFTSTDLNGLATGNKLSLIGASSVTTVDYYDDGGGVHYKSLPLTGFFTVASSSVASGEVTVVLSSPENDNSLWARLNSDYTGNFSVVCENGGVGSVIGLTNSSFQVLTVSDKIMTVTPNFSFVEERGLGPAAVIRQSGAQWQGPFTIKNSKCSGVICNFVATNGLYMDDGRSQYRTDVTVEIEVTPVDATGTPIGSPETFQATIEGSASTQSQRAVTIRANLVVRGYQKIRARRVTRNNTTFNGTVVDEIKWRDCYSVEEITATDFGNVTTVFSKSYATAGALALKERKLNMKVTRKLPQRVSGSTFTSTLYPTNDVADILSFVCLDSKIGNRTLAEVDFDSFYDTSSEIQTYFGSSKASEFSYTFDSSDLSFEETVKTIADCVYSSAFRRGNIIKIQFEKENESSVLLFNHRNKIPESETRTVRFGNQDDFDGVEFKYVDPEDDAQVTYFLPYDQNYRNPKEIESVGVRTKLQAHFHAWRAWNKIRYQNTIVEFTGTQEADILALNDRILVADNTRPDVQDGEVESQNGLELFLSQKVDLTGYVSNYIFLQMPSGTVESISITQGSSENSVILQSAPSETLALDENLYARTTYMITGATENKITAFLVSEKEPQDNFTSVVRAYNYDSRYYSNDSDLLNSVINEDGEIL